MEQIAVNSDSSSDKTFLLLANRSHSWMANFRTSRSVCFAVVAALTFLCARCEAEEFQISLNSGSVISVSASDQKIVWTDVLADGRMKNRDIDFSEIRRLSLTWSPASDQVSEIRHYLTLLASEDYHERTLAEEKLTEGQIGGRFLPLIRAELEHPKKEVRFRIRRILVELETAEVETVSEFDILTLKDGTTLEGDAGEFRLNCLFRNQRLTLTREDISLVAQPEAIRQPAAAGGQPVQVEMFQQHGEQFYQPSQTLIDFETSPTGSELGRNTDVSKMFVPNGLILGTDEPGFVGISGYGFKFKALPPKDNSVCVFKTIGKFPQRFKGVMELHFCLPNQQSVRAGVHELGLFIARVNHSRDFIMEAYNADGHLLGSVEASDQQYVFMGIKSTEPITFVRILSNPYLFRVNRKIDEDFAIDHICFSPPVPVGSDATPEQGFVKLKNGDLLKGKTIQLTDDQVTIEGVAIQQTLTIPLKEVQSIQFPTAIDEQTARTRDWFVMLDDRSVLKVVTGTNFASQLFGKLRLQPEQIAGLWLGRNGARMPAKGDFDRGNNVMVFPTCRLASSDVEFQSTGYAWEESIKIEQDIKLDKENQDDDDDPTPDVNQVDYSSSSVENIPTIWTSPPPGRPAGSGRIRFSDGQQLSLGANSRFQIVEFKEESLTISTGDQIKSFPYSKVISIDLPDD